MMTSMLQEVDDMTSVVIREPPSSPSQIVVVYGLHRRYFGMHSFAARYPTDVPCVAIATPSHEHVADRGARGVKRGAWRHPGRGAEGGRPPVPPAPERYEHVDPGHVVVERGEGSGSGQPTVDPFDSPNLDMLSFSLGLTPASQSLPSGSETQLSPAPGLGFTSFQSPHSTSYGFSRFRAPSPPDTSASAIS
ncbi:hypothetical protein M9H77_23744 [Catharanthus roseus]|uniref:Uncharacterized protein n=1 Tax=Catharanthus roseus TaxID=4058 RepID=A0ACC0AUL7_CATRO|nr:hypothetical protein M9H77_23744 [Catharanthus roseus]